MENPSRTLSVGFIKFSRVHGFSFQVKRFLGNKTLAGTVSTTRLLPRIPTEVAILVFSHIHADLRATFEGPLLPDYTTSLPGTEQAYRCAIYQARSRLHAVGQVCRAWYRASIPLLYSHVVVLSHLQLSLFRRTVANSASLAGFVKSLSILLTRSVSSMTSLGFPSHLLSRMDGNFGAEAQNNALFIILHCPSLHAIAFRLPNYLPGYPGRGLNTLTNSISRLRKLSLHGHTSHDFSGDEFPHLEVLSLHWARLGSRLRLPSCPHLHTLQLLQTYAWSDSRSSRILIPPEKMPQLKTLHLHHNSFSVSAFHEKVTHSFPRVRSLYLVGSYEECAFRSLAQSSALSALHHLVLGDIGLSDHPLADWVLPRSLRTLTIFVDLDQKIISLKILPRFLRLNELEIKSGLTSLRIISINVYWGEPDELEPELEELVDIEMEDVRDLCEILGISVEFDVSRPTNWLIDHAEVASQTAAK